MLRLIQFALLGLLFMTASASAQDASAILREDDLGHLRTALDSLNMTETDLGFAKDHGEPRFVFPRVRELLAEPLELPVLGDDVLEAVRGGDTSIWSFAASMYTCDLAAEMDAPVSPPDWGSLDPVLATALSDYLRGAADSFVLVAKAFGETTEEERSYVATSFLSGVFNAEDREEVREQLADVGLPPELVQQVILESSDLDPEPSSSHYLDIVEKVDWSSLLVAGQRGQEAASQLRMTALAVEAWPEEPIHFEIEGESIWVGTRGNDQYAGDAVLILDPGGHDVYRGRVGVANGLLGDFVSCIVDLAGDDRYETDGLLGAGSGLFGVSVVIDGSGDDTYRAAGAGQGVGLFGVGWLHDDQGDDSYKAYALGQGASYAGVGVLRDAEGEDTYAVGFYGQAFAGVQGIGILIDDWGNDRYLAGGQEPDHERHQDRFLSLAQGFSIGMRPMAGGGIAALVDLAGNDIYQADIYGQGVSYWYSAGLLLDAGGNDTYSMYHYGQGSGIHLSSGLLFDAKGNDLYTGFILAQGNAHDYAIGMLIDHEGDDTYTADHHSQGRALNTACALLLDGAGNDAYFARQPDQCQGIGNSGDKREYGSLALLLDLDGEDSYSCEAEDGARLLRPHFGVVYDVLPMPEENGESEGAEDE